MQSVSVIQVLQIIPVTMQTRDLNIDHVRKYGVLVNIISERICSARALHPASRRQSPQIARQLLKAILAS